MDAGLLNRFDGLIGKRGYTNRSEAIRDFVRKELVNQGNNNGSSRAFGVLSFVYDHHVRELEAKITDFQHAHYKSIISASHVHTDQKNCLQVIILSDKAAKIGEIAEKILSFKGVKHGRLSLSPSGEDI